MNYTKILVVDDDSNIRDLLKQGLENEGYEVRTAADGYEAIDSFKKYEPDIMLLDIMLPGKSGRDVCSEIRKFSTKPIIMITAKGDVVDKVVCLELGRCNTHEEPGDSEVIKFENIEISKQKYELKLKGRSVDIPPKELELLYFLASNYNRVFTRDQLLDKVWGFDYLGDSRTVDVHVKRLREKLDGVSDKWTLKTVWGVGYKFEVVGN